ARSECTDVAHPHGCGFDRPHYEPNFETSWHRARRGGDGIHHPGRSRSTMPLVECSWSGCESLMRAPGFVFGVAAVFQKAIGAARFPRDTDFPSKMNYAMGKVDPGRL